MRRTYLLLTLIMIILKAQFGSAQTPDVTVSVNRSLTINPRSALLLGITYDARSSLRSNSGQVGYHDTNGVMLPSIQPLFGNFPMPTVRYPANAVMNGFDWKKSIGPISARIPQSIVGSGPPQRMRFGFDEFMSMAAGHGAQPKDVQIMLTIYSKQSAGLTLVQTAAAIDSPAVSAADWVEYANGPNNGSNWGGGIDWAKVRAENGRSAPYGIEIWNLGNEPWAVGECGNDSAGAVKYINFVQPMIDSMLSRDPTIKITVPGTGPATSAWNKQMLNHPVIKGRIYGLSSHFFPDETMSGGSIPLGVAKVENALPALAETTQAHGVKLFIGDYAHGIPTANGVPTGDPDLAMQWQGANLSADFLMLISRFKNIERANFWAYGTPVAVWHPIRFNGPGNYTLMPAAVMYQKLFPLFLDRSISVQTLSPKGSDGNAYSVRAGGFLSNDSSKCTVILVNRDKLNASLAQVNGMTGYTVNSIVRWRGNALTSDDVIEENVTADINGNIAVPPMSIVAVNYGKNTLTVSSGAAVPEEFRLFQNYPNPFNPQTTIRYSISHTDDVVLTVYDNLGRITARLVDEVQQAGSYSIRFDASSLATGVYLVELRYGSHVQSKKMILMR